ncbi:ribosome small subunit-dependent GTPase A [Cohnella endophytica]|uniref:Small ribosomal subunit biogenesis GTPase RsgA n=1 Tax=Cohnella endophytica TaxID=2419778 RepID=A0A494YDF5_9BACL|nr:ribosome small subunit-dependent GTPase A [Cohnella endophytica]
MIENNQLQAYGWNQHWDDVLSRHFANASENLSPARVIAQFSHSYSLMTESGEHSAVVTGKFEFNAAKRGDYPAVGDWVLVAQLPNERRSVIHAVLPRRSAMVRKVAGQVLEDQIIGANLDYLFIVNALNLDFNLRKIERYLIAAWESGAKPIVLLTKADLVDDPANFASQVEQIAPGVPVHVVSAHRDQGKEALQAYMQPGNTIGVTGSSGVGKSTLLNWLAGEDLQHVQGIRESDARGRHTTTHRELFLLQGGALFMDTPGMRELQLWDADEGIQHAFSDIEALADHCRYRDCRHENAQGCAVLDAIEAGELDAKRLANYRKTSRELARLARKDQAGSAKSGQKSARAKPSKPRPRANQFADWDND